MRDILLALFIFGTIPFIFSRPYIGLVWSWIGYMNPHRMTYGFAYNFPWVMLIAVVTLISLAISKERKRIPMSSVSVLLFALLAWTGVATVFSVVPDAAWPKFEEFAKIQIMIFVTLMLVNTRERIHWLVWVIAVSLGFFGVKGGIFTALGGGVNHVIGPPGSFIGDNNALALALSMTLPLMRYLQLHSTKKWVRVGLGVAILLTGVAILGTYSRGGVVALAIVAGAMFLKSRGRLVLIVVIGVVVVAGYQFMPQKWQERMGTLHHAETVNSAQTRIQSWKFATKVALHRPFTGGGFEIYQSTVLWQRFAPQGAKQRAIHSIYFRMLGEQGFVGLGLFLALLFASWRKCSKTRKLTRGEPELRWAFDLASMLQVSIVAYMVAGAALPMPYFDMSYQLMALCALVCTHSINEIAARETAKKRSPRARLPVTDHAIHEPV
jgi:probable O-glycosylation ligase (exosortase A-associated)